MEIKISNGKFTISGDLQAPVQSKTGKTYVVASTRGFVNAVDDKGKTYSISINITTKEK